MEILHDEYGQGEGWEDDLLFASRKIKMDYFHSNLELFNGNYVGSLGRLQSVMSMGFVQASLQTFLDGESAKVKKTSSRLKLKFFSVKENSQRPRNGKTNKIMPFNNLTGNTTFNAMIVKASVNTSIEKVTEISGEIEAFLVESWKQHEEVQEYLLRQAAEKDMLVSRAKQFACRGLGVDDQY